MRRLTSVALLSVFLFACQKDVNYLNQGATQAIATADKAASENTGDYFVKFNAGNGVENYQFNTSAFLGDAGTAKSLVLQASANPDDPKQESIHLYLSFLSGSPAVGTYKQGDPAFKTLVSGSFNPVNPNFTYSAGLSPVTESPLTVTISSISNGVIKGTFKGAFYKHDLSTGVMSETEFVDYREGEFSLPIQ
jgi:hypothetical protein